MSRNSLVSRLSQVQKMDAGIQQHLASESAITLDGKDYKPGDLHTICQGYLLAAAAVAPSKAAWQAKVDAQRVAEAAYLAIEPGLHRFLVTTYGPKSPILADFGWQPKVAQPKPVKVKAVAVSKGAETRKLRGTLGPKQKAGIKAGNVVAASAGLASKPGNGESSK